jgi:RNA polymerase sigma-54 factor
MELKTVLKLQQQLVMTPQLQQAIRLLQLSRLELVDEVRKELDGNPILMDEDNNDGSKQRSNDSGDPANLARAQDEEFRKNEPSRENETAAKEVDWEKFLENRTLQQPSEGSKGPSGFDDLPPIEQNLTRSESLREHLLWQLQLGEFTDEERRFGELVIGNRMARELQI